MGKLKLVKVFTYCFVYVIIHLLKYQGEVIGCIYNLFLKHVFIISRILTKMLFIHVAKNGLYSYSLFFCWKQGSNHMCNHKFLKTNIQAH